MDRKKGTIDLLRTLSIIDDTYKDNISNGAKREAQRDAILDFCCNNKFKLNQEEIYLIKIIGFFDDYIEWEKDYIEYYGEVENDE